MKQITSFDLIQNVAISSLALHSFTLGYYSVANKRNDKRGNYPSVKYFFYILPLIYHEDSLDNFYQNNNLHRVFAHYPEISAQLQHRANKMSIQTFDALNLAFSTKLLKFNEDHQIIQQLRLTDIAELWPQDIKKIVVGSRKLGFFFAKTSEQTLRLRFNILI